MADNKVAVLKIRAVSLKDRKDRFWLVLGATHITNSISTAVELSSDEEIYEQAEYIAGELEVVGYMRSKRYVNKCEKINSYLEEIYSQLTDDLVSACREIRDKGYQSTQRTFQDDGNVRITFTLEKFNPSPEHL